ncbi:DUF1345 domain-containing protein [Corynebacterium sp. UBA2622]|uniref:DUF1345 domain-containing protein n=1 Tax=Corynebacterium sp. UBA2622 TaxID=1946393 RepID=UPI0025C3C0BC|nr:DUF1345 domain-containing protein [Corynebacterium sp. UBA2622]
MAGGHGRPTRRQLARRNSAILAAVFVLASAAVGFLSDWWRAPAYGWGAASLVYLVLVWSQILPYDGAMTRDHANSEEPSRVSRLLLTNVATLISFVSVGMLMVAAKQAEGIWAWIEGLLVLVTVFSSWMLINTVFILRYADLYYSDGPEGGLDFNQDTYLPTYRDFTYMGLSMGMTYQVSDTSISKPSIRWAATAHAIYAYIFGIALTASAINLVMSLVD